jgi:RNA polymerase sigma factor (sigma-70 family)
VSSLTDCSIYEKELIAACQKRNAHSQEKLFKHFYGFVMGITLRYVSTRVLAQEIVNDSFLKIFNQLPKQNDIQSFRAWANRIVVHTAIDTFRRENKYRQHTDIEQVVHELTDHENISSQISAQEILLLINKLPDTWRYVFNLYEIEGFSHEEIGEKLKIPTSSSRTYLTRAKQKLRELIISN